VTRSPSRRRFVGGVGARASRQLRNPKCAACSLCGAAGIGAVTRRQSKSKLRRPPSKRWFVSGLLALVLLAALSLSFGADAQHAAMPRRIGVLLVAWAPSDRQPQQLIEGLREAGYVEGRDVIIEWRFAAGDYGRAPALAADLVAKQVDIILTDSTPAALAAKQSTSAIPIVTPALDGFVTRATRGGR
jgi:hypothetical protein